MKNKNELDLEELNCAYPEIFSGVELMYRAKIPGGWIVLIKGDDATPGFFVPDPDHIWNGGSLP